MNKTKKKKKESLIKFLGKYKFAIFIVIILSIAINILGLLIPRVISPAINSLFQGSYSESNTLLKFGGLATSVLLLTVIQTVLGNYLSEKIAKDLRTQIIDKLAKQSYGFINNVTPSKLLTNLTSDVDQVKAFIAQGIISVFSAIVLLIGSAAIMLTINWRVGLPLVLLIPILGIYFGFIFSKIKKYFDKMQALIDRLNKVINESIVGAALIRVLNSKHEEISKFEEVNEDIRVNGVEIVKGFSSLIPFVQLIANLGTLIIVWYGGSKVINGTFSIGDFTSFFSYIGTFIMPIFILGFLGNIIAAAFTSYERIKEVIDSKEPKYEGKVVADIKGDLKFSDINYSINKTPILKNITFEVKPGTKTGIIGPTAAGKTQLFYLLAGLIQPDDGEITLDNVKINDYDPQSLYEQLGLVFQDSIIFNTTILENIQFSTKVDKADMEKAIETAELKEFIDSLPKGLDTMISERGSSLSGGQKQRITLARALALNPKILLLDDFTARVDLNTEKRIIDNLKKNYPELTLLSITQKIASVEDFEQVILIMEGELIAKGTHKELLKNSLEYSQIFDSQHTT